MFAFHACLFATAVPANSLSGHLIICVVKAEFPNKCVVFFPHQRLEADLSYWMDHARANDQGRQHHYDENAPMGPRDTSSYRHGANVNYDYY